jgi:hypothetical protein
VRNTYLSGEPKAKRNEYVTSCKSKSFILTKLKPLTRSLVSSWSLKTHSGRKVMICGLCKTGFGESGVLPTGSQRIETSAELFDEIWKEG